MYMGDGKYEISINTREGLKEFILDREELQEIVREFLMINFIQKYAI